MAVGEERPIHGKNGCWKDCLAIALDEATTALEENIYDLTDEQIWSRPIAERHSIAALVLHVLENLNFHACEVQTGEAVEGVSDEGWHDMWGHSPQELDALQAGRDRPGREQMPAWLGAIRARAMDGLAAADEDDLRGARAGSEWSRRSQRPAGDAYTRTIFHTMAHVRQIWCLGGAMGAYGPNAWPHQHYA